jgi:GTPase SAR1 family protein
VLVLGIDNSGKSSLVDGWLRGGEPLPPSSAGKPVAPTTGFNIQELLGPSPPWWAWWGSTKLNCWELGGAPGIRPYWRRYFDDPQSGAAHGVVFAVDGSNGTRFDEALLALRAILVAGVLPPTMTTLLLCVTKADIAAEAQLEDSQSRELVTVAEDWAEKAPPAVKRNVMLLTVSSHTGTGVSDALQWLQDHVQ